MCSRICIACLLLCALPRITWADETDSAKECLERGLDLLDSGKLDAAEREYTEAIRLDPASATAYYNRARTQFEKRDFAAAIKDLSEVIRLKYELPLAYFGRADARFNAQMELDEAIQDCNESIRLDPTSAESYTLRANIYAYKSDNELAIKDYTQAIKLNPKGPIAYLGRGCCWAKKQDYAAAIDDLNEAIRLRGSAYTY